MKQECVIGRFPCSDCGECKEVEEVERFYNGEYLISFKEE